MIVDGILKALETFATEHPQLKIKKPVTACGVAWDAAQAQ